MKLEEILKNNSYPGRGIGVGLTPDGENAAMIYFIMGRSVNSRNRVFKEIDGGIKTEAFDPSKLSDPSLVIYNPVRTFGDYKIVTNGDQTDTVYDFLSAGKSFCDALKTREFEPDHPNFTPRISALVDTENDLKATFSILKNSGDGIACDRFFYFYDSFKKGTGKFISTYKCDGDPLPTFDCEPITIEIGNDINTVAADIYGALNEENKVSLFVCFKNLKTKKEETVIINKNKKEEKS